MATYLKIQNGTKTKEYTLTSNYPKPYIKVSNSILPLTTRTTTGMHLKAQNGGTSYRPLEYVSTSQSASTSESTTYNTSNADGVGLSSTTALTRESTSKTVYDTRASTSSTVYGKSSYGWSYGSYNNANYWRLEYYSGVTYKNGATLYGNPITYSNTNTNYGGSYRDTRTSLTLGVANPPLYYSVTRVATTGTTYLTRASTYQTRYLTCESTSGYSGVSSSSSSASSSTSAMTWD